MGSPETSESSSNVVNKGRKPFFDLKGHNTNWSKEVLGGLTTFFAMAYILAVNSSILSGAGMPAGAVVIATAFAAMIGTLFMGLFANVPYALAPGMGLNAFFTYTVVDALGFTWQEALTMVFICGLINILVTVTKVRKMLIKAIPESLQNAIGGGIGVFLIFLGLVNVGFINFSSGVPALSDVSTATLGVFVFGLVLGIVLNVLKVPGAMIITIIVTTLFGLIPFGGQASVTDFEANSVSFVEAFQEFPETFGVIFTQAGFGSLFGNAAKIPEVLMAIFAFSMSDTFDTIGTFIGTGRKTGIFTDDDMKALENSSGFHSRMDKALFADSIATSIGAILGTSNTTTFVESAAGIGEGAKTGLASVVTAICFALSVFLVGPITAIPFAATAPVLILVGCMMLSSFKDIEWNKLEAAIPAMFAGIFMAFSYSISDGMAYGFISYVLIDGIVYLSSKVKYAYVASNVAKYKTSVGSDKTLTYVDGSGTIKTLAKATWNVSVILEVCAALFLAYFIVMPILDSMTSAA